jgi:hypothetical protein
MPHNNPEDGIIRIHVLFSFSYNVETKTCMKWQWYYMREMDFRHKCILRVWNIMLINFLLPHLNFNILL